MRTSFIATVERFDMQGGWHYVPVPADLVEPFMHLRNTFGFIAITVHVGKSFWSTSLLPKGDGTYFIALSANVRKVEGIGVGSGIKVFFEASDKAALAPTEVS